MTIGEGVGLFVKEGINYKERKDLSVFIPHVFESLFVEITNTSVYSKNKIIGIIFKAKQTTKSQSRYLLIHINGRH